MQMRQIAAQQGNIDLLQPLPFGDGRELLGEKSLKFLQIQTVGATSVNGDIALQEKMLHELADPGLHSFHDLPAAPATD